MISTKKTLKLLFSLLLVSGFFYLSASNAYVQWKSFDPNCTNNDISFTGLDGKKYDWAGCNSTLGGAARQYGSGGMDYGNGVYKCLNSKVANPSIFFSYLTKETDITGGACKMDSIMGKMYAWAYLQNNCKASSGNNFLGTNNTNCACPDGRHVPTKDELQAAKNYYIVYANSPDPDQYIGWGGSATASGLAMQLRLPLNGIGDGANFGNRGRNGFYWSSTISGGNASYAYGMMIMGQGFSTYLGTDYASRLWIDPTTNGGIRQEKGVRCLRDERTEPVFFTSKSYVQSGSEYVGTNSFSVQDIYDEKGSSTIGVNIVMQSSDTKTKVSIPAGTKIINSGSASDYTGSINTPELLSTGSVSGFSGVLALARVGNIGESIQLRSESGDIVLATVRVAVPGVAPGTSVIIRYSNDGTNWYNHSTSVVINIGGESYVEFTTDHFTDFLISGVWHHTVDGNLSLQILTGVSDCQYGTSLYLGAQDVKLDETYSFSGAFTGDWYCADYKGYTGGWAFTIQTSDLINDRGSVISSGNLLISHNPVSVSGDVACTGGVGTATAFSAAPYTMFQKAPDVDKLCRVATSNVGLEINVPANQSPGSYSGTLTIYIPNFY